MNFHPNWIDLFKEELSIAQTTGLEIILMGDFNIDFTNCASRKWLNLLELFDLKQMVTSTTRETRTQYLLSIMYIVQDLKLFLTALCLITPLVIICLFVL